MKLKKYRKNHYVSSSETSQVIYIYIYIILIYLNLIEINEFKYIYVYKLLISYKRNL